MNRFLMPIHELQSRDVMFTVDVVWVYESYFVN